jgi:hypothetical protein
MKTLKMSWENGCRRNRFRRLNLSAPICFPREKAGEAFLLIFKAKII